MHLIDFLFANMYTSMTSVVEFWFDDKDQLGVDFNLKISSRYFLVFKDIFLDYSLDEHGLVCYWFEIFGELQISKHFVFQIDAQFLTAHLKVNKSQIQCKNLFVVYPQNCITGVMLMYTQQ